MVASTASAAPATRKHKSSPLLRIQSSTLSLKLPRLQRRLKGPRRAYPTPPIRLVQPGLCLGRALYSNLTQAGIRRSPAARADMAAPSAISPAVPFQPSKGRVFLASAPVGALFPVRGGQRCHIRNAPFVLTQYGWFSLSQRSDAKSPGTPPLRSTQSLHS
jgi:hypothetical protein